MTRAVFPGQGAGIEPLYDTDPRTGATVEVFYANRIVAKSFSACPGWYWRRWRGGSFADMPIGPFATQYAAYRNVAASWLSSPHRVEAR